MAMNDTSGTRRRVIHLQLRFNNARQNEPHLQPPSLEPEPPSPTVALLIDGENIDSSHLIPQMLEVAARLGNATIRRVYGNWRNNKLDFDWRIISIKYSLQPVHSIKGKEKEKKYGGDGKEKPKNGSDISLVIGALDLFYQYGIKHFCLVTGDSDYLPLVMYLREAGCTVVGIGKPDTHQSLRIAYDEFLTTDDLEVVHSSLRSKSVPLELPPPARSNHNGVSKQTVPALPRPIVPPEAKIPSTEPAPPSPLPGEETLDELLMRAYRWCLNRPKYKDLPDDEKWIYNPDFGDSLKKLNNDYMRAYEGEIGGMKLRDYLKKRTDLFEWRDTKTAHQIEIKLRTQSHEHAPTPTLM